MLSRQTAPAAERLDGPARDVDVADGDPYAEPAEAVPEFLGIGGGQDEGGLADPDDPPGRGGAPLPGGGGVRGFLGMGGREDEDGLADPDDAREMDEALLEVADAAFRFRDPNAAEHDLGDLGRDGSRGARHVVRQQHPLPLVSLDRHAP